MNKNFYTIAKNDLFDLFERLSKAYSVIVPYRRQDKLFFDKFNPEKIDSIELGIIRQTQPFKSFLTSPREKVFGSLKDRTRPVIVAGVKGCDLQSLILQDYVFQQGDYEDPFYSKNRADTIIISTDCTVAKETCFCLAMDGAPYPQKYYDINLSMLGDYFLVEVASEKGMSLVSGYKTFFKNTDSRDVALRDANRKRISVEVRNFIEKRGTPGTAQIKGAVKNNYNNLPLWQDFASTCVECGACNLGCPTCHCFLLFDEKDGEKTDRLRIWDSCLYKTFARVAGGANPRKHLHERLRNRFEKKFDFFPQVLDYFACTGCGRCIEACPGDIDLREVLKGLVNGKWNKPPNE